MNKVYLFIKKWLRVAAQLNSQFKEYHKNWYSDSMWIWEIIYTVPCTKLIGKVLISKSGF